MFSAKRFGTIFRKSLICSAAVSSCAWKLPNIAPTRCDRPLIFSKYPSDAPQSVLQILKRRSSSRRRLTIGSNLSLDRTFTPKTARWAWMLQRLRSRWHWPHWSVNDRLGSNLPRCTVSSCIAGVTSMAAFPELLLELGGILPSISDLKRVARYSVSSLGINPASFKALCTCVQEGRSMRLWRGYGSFCIVACHMRGLPLSQPQLNFAVDVA